MNTLFVKNRRQWRDWLDRNATSVEEIWVVYRKRELRKPGVTYEETVEEALCFGWIDGKIKKIDDQCYARSFTPRKAGSRWSALNLARAEKLAREGKMTAAGLAAYENKRKTEPLPTRLPPALEKLFRQQSLAWQNFQAFPAHYRRITAGWVASAKKEQTQLKRLRQLISFSMTKKRIRFI